MLGDYDAGTALAVKDIEAAKDFYGNKLGLQVASENQGGVQYKSGDSQFFVYQSEFAGTNKATYMGWNVENIEQIVEDLKAKGVEFETYDLPGATVKDNIHDWDGAKTAFFKDPSGNILAINSGM
jgi:catechol 2,3-dioxygenase-like lactoylglutathione lyase family enzyme